MSPVDDHSYVDKNMKETSIQIDEEGRVIV